MSNNLKYESDSTNVYINLAHDENITNNQPVEPLRCRFCEICLTDADMSIKHSIEVHTNKIGLYICLLCDFGFSNPDDLREHINTIHQKQFKNKSRNFQCTVCQRRYTSEIHLQKHTCIKGLSGQVALHCEVCNQSFPSKVRLNFHRQFHLKNARPLYCFQCMMNFKDENSYFDHVYFLHDLKQVFVCNICDKTFNLRSSYNNHKKMHVGDRNYKCEICNKLFINKQTLQEHEVVHLSNKPYQCDVCGEKYSRLSRLKKHLLTHDSTPVINDVNVCSVCMECFANLEIGNSHCGNKHSDEESCIEIISTDRVFRCEFCEKCYTTPDALNSHRKGHSGNPLPYSCHICKVEFSSYAR